MKIRVFALILSLIMVFLCFAGCGSSNDDLGTQGSTSKTESGKSSSVDNENTDKPDEKKSVFATFVVDVSASMAPLKEKTVAAMREAVANLEKENEKLEISIITYSSFVEYQTPRTESGYDRLVDEFEQGSFKYHSGTNEANALTTAATTLNSVSADKKKVLLFTDGKATDGNSTEAIEQLSRMGAELTTVYIGHEEEIQLVSVTTKGRVPYKEKATLDVTVRSTVAEEAKFTIKEDGVSVLEKHVALEKGENKITLSYSPTRAGVNLISVDVESRNDGLSGNNTLWSWFLYEEKYSMLIVDGDSGSEGGEQITHLIDNGLFETLEDYQVFVVAPKKLPGTLEGLLAYDQIVLMDVDFSSLSKGTGENLKRYVGEYGRSLFVSFGEKFYDIDKGFDGSAFDEILPVRLKREGEIETAAVVLVVDLSASMKEIVPGTDRSRFEALVESVKGAISLSSEDGGLSDEDYIGVVCFDKNAYVALDLMQIGDSENRNRLCEDVEWELRHYYNWYYLNPDGTESDYPVTKDDGDTYIKLGYSYPSAEAENPLSGYDRETNRAIKSYGTNYKWAVQAASDMLERKSAETVLNIKNVMFMSDGAPNDLGLSYVGIVEEMAKAGIKTSAIALGENLEADSQAQHRIELMKIAEAGKGNFFTVETEEGLGNAIASGVRDAANSKEFINERPVLPKSNTNASKVLQGVRDFEVIGGYYPSTIKEGANLVLYVDMMRPLYADWDFGLGRVGVFMSDLGNKEWTGSLLDSPNEGLRLVHNMLTVNLNCEQNSSGVEYAIENAENGVNVEVLVPAELGQNEELEGRIYHDDSASFSNYKFTKVAPNRYVASIDIGFNEAWALELVVVNQDGGATQRIAQLGVTVGYSDEYDVLPAPNDNNDWDDNNDESQESEQEGEQKRVKIAFVSKRVTFKNGEKNVNSSLLYTALAAAGYRISSDDMFESASEAEGINGYDLYIYEGIAPTFLPTDGAVWLLDADGTYDWKLGIEVSDVIEENKQNGFKIEAAGNEAAQELTKGTDAFSGSVALGNGEELGAAVASFRPMNLLNDSFAPVLSAEDNVIMAVGEHNGNTIIISTFDFSESSLAVFITDFPIFIRNMVKYSVK